MISVGARLGAYEVLAPLGAGGMGEVWRARDTRLGREVAIKVLPEGFASDPERVSRFEREARLLATLNHPGIATIHGFEQSNGVSLLILELVEGPTLAERLRRGPLPIREALAVACGIAGALEAAHDKGIIHRDLKPSNVKVLNDGRVKLLDFGLAKALRTDLPAEEISQRPTQTSPTEAGVLLGTAPYMSPEQARGEAVDERTDVWAFGCVLYEMLTGKRAFAGASASDVIAAILEREPDWAALPPNVPPAVRSTLGRCLKKDKIHRLRHIVDGRIELEEATAEPTKAPSSLPSAGPRRGTLKAAAAVAAAAIAGAALSWLWLRPTKTRARPPTRLNIDLSPSAPLPTASDTSVLIAISPDGTEIVYQSVGPRLYSRSLSRPTAVPVPGIDRGWGPFFSPDGRWLGFSADGKLQKVATTGGTPRVLAEAPWLRGASWAEDATIVYTPTAWSGLFRVSAEGGEPQRLTEPDPQSETSHRFPQVLPGGQSVIYTIHAPSGRDDDARVAALSLPTGIRKVLVKGGTYGRYVPTGHLLYASGGTVFAAPFDARRLEVTGPAAAVLEDVRMGANSTGAAQLDFSTSGTLVYITPHDRPRQRSLAWVDRKGSVVARPSERRPFRNIRLSPDGRRLIAEIESSNGVDLWLHETSRQTWTRLTFEKDNFSPVWSPDGTRIAFASNRTGARNLFWMPTEGGAAERITTSPQWQDATDWPPEEGVLIFQQLERENGWDIWDISLDGNRRARPLMATRFSEWDGVISPDGRWLAFGSNESGRAEVYVRAYHDDRVGRKWLVSTNGGWEPHWSRTGRELFYRNVDRLMSVAVSEGPTFRAAEPVALFERPFVTYDVAPDGKRFVLLEDAEQEPERLQVVVIPDWFEELKARVPVPR